MFTEGTAVEVSFREENHDVWHVGTVMKVTGTNKCLVNFHCPRDGNEDRGQEFSSSDVRPSPPNVEDNVFVLREEVEAYFECCWWSGVIKKLLVDRKYRVLIKHSKKEMEFDHVNVRPRMFWTDGKWSNEAKVANRPGMLTRQSGRLNRLKTRAEEQKSGRLNRLKTRAEEQQSGNGCASAGINTSPDKVIVTIHNFHTTWNDDTEKDYTGVHVEEIVDKECTTEEVDLSVKEVKGARSAKKSEVPRKKDQKKQNRDQEIHVVDSIEGSIEGNNIAKRKRGRPKKLSKKQIGERSTVANMDMKESCVGDAAKSSAENDFVTSTIIDEIPKNGDFQPSRPSKERAVLVYKRKLKSRVRRHNDHEKYDDIMIDDTNDDQLTSMCLNILPPICSDDSRALSVSRQDNSGTPPFNQENAMESAPLQKKDGPGDLPVNSLNQCAASNDKGGGLGTPAIVGIDTMEKEQNLPFVKRSVCWKNIDSMETYKKMTQKPHFAPLYEHMKETREGLAIGRMVNFFNLVEDTSKLKFSSDIAVIERGLKSLAEFKSHGFDVEKVQASLTQLLLKKQLAEELLREYEDIGSKISNSIDNGELDEEISQLCQDLREIEKKLGEAKLKKENREKALSALQSERDTIGENVKILQVEFESIVGSLCQQEATQAEVPNEPNRS